MFLVKFKGYVLCKLQIFQHCLIIITELSLKLESMPQCECHKLDFKPSMTSNAWSSKRFVSKKINHKDGGVSWVGLRWYKNCILIGFSLHTAKMSRLSERNLHFSYYGVIESHETSQVMVCYFICKILWIRSS